MTMDAYDLMMDGGPIPEPSSGGAATAPTTPAPVTRLSGEVERLRAALRFIAEHAAPHNTVAMRNIAENALPHPPEGD